MENLSATEGPVIFACNHQSAWDAPVILRRIERKVAIAADADYVFGIGTKGTLRRKVYRKVTGILTAFFFNTYPFGATIGTRVSLAATGEMLDREYSILVFPEGQRTTDGSIRPFKEGIGYVAISMDVPVIPIKVQGLFHVLPVRKLWPKRGKSIVTFGSPIEIKYMTYQEATARIEQEVRQL